MFILKRAGCRVVQAVFRLALPLLPYREPRILQSYDELGEVLLSGGAHSSLIVTSAGSVKRGLLSPIKEALQRRGIRHAVYDKTKPNPTVENVEDGLRMYYENSCDTVIAIGGGSALDCAKGIGARVAHPKRELNRLAGVMRVTRKIPTLVAIPTTAGTGSETTLAAVITDDKTHRKYAIMSFPLIPHYAILDAGLTCTLPPFLTATTGMDALTHAVEAYIGCATCRKTRKLATDAVKLIFENIEQAYRDGNNRKARENMLLASYKAGVAFSMSYVGYVHAIAHSLGGKYDTPHGLANAVILPHVLLGYGKSVYRKLHTLGVATGVCSRDDSYEAGAKRFVSAISALCERMSIPATIQDIREEDIPELARLAEREANPLYPVPKLMDAVELRSFYYKIAGFSEGERRR